MAVKFTTQWRPSNTTDIVFSSKKKYGKKIKRKDMSEVL